MNDISTDIAQDAPSGSRIQLLQERLRDLDIVLVAPLLDERDFLALIRGHLGDEVPIPVELPRLEGETAEAYNLRVDALVEEMLAALPPVGANRDDALGRLLDRESDRGMRIYRLEDREDVREQMARMEKLSALALPPGGFDHRAANQAPRSQRLGRR